MPSTDKCSVSGMRIYTSWSILIPGSSGTCSQVSNTVNSKYCGPYFDPSQVGQKINIPICGTKLDLFLGGGQFLFGQQLKHSRRAHSHDSWGRGLESHRMLCFCHLYPISNVSLIKVPHGGAQPWAGFIGSAILHTRFFRVRVPINYLRLKYLDSTMYQCPRLVEYRVQVELSWVKLV